jgi:hydroxyacylglutathione hydrolase
VLRKTAKIGYEGNVAGALLAPATQPATSLTVDVAAVRQHPEQFTIVDIRNRTEAHDKVFTNALLIPLPELRERVQEIPTDKPVLVHCAGGYRSAAGASIIEAALPGVEVFAGDGVRTLLLIFLLMTSRVAFAQATRPWPRNPTTHKIEFSVHLPLPDTVRIRTRFV